MKKESKYFNTALLMDQALLMLLEHKDYEFITVKEVCSKAGVNRSTFYLHYESMDDLLVETLELINTKFLSTFDNETIDPIYSSKEELYLIDEKHLMPYLTLIKENKRIYKLIHNKPELFHNQKAYKELYNNLFKVILDKYGVDDKEKEYVFSFFSQGVLAIIDKWIEKDCVDDIDLIINIIKKSIRYE